jgi:hypothetical protein
MACKITVTAELEVPDSSFGSVAAGGTLVAAVTAAMPAAAEATGLPSVPYCVTVTVTDDVVGEATPPTP